LSDPERSESVTSEPLPADSGDLLRAVIAGASVGLGLLDAELRFVRVNDALVRLSGRPRQAHLGRRLDDAWPGVPEALLDALEALLEDGRAVPEQTLVVDADGSPRRLRAGFHRVGAPGDPPGIGVSVTGTGEPAGSESPLHDRLDRLPLIALEVDPDGRIVYANDQLSALAGYPVEELLGRSFFEVFDPHDEEGRVTRTGRSCRSWPSARTSPSAGAPSSASRCSTRSSAR
jgi:PAS domain-containing protein